MYIPVSGMILLGLLLLVCLVYVEYIARMSYRSVLGWVSTTDDTYLITTWYILMIRVWERRVPHSTGWY